MMQEPRGYTLLELIVSIGIFSMVMLVVIGAYLTLISYDRQARATNDLTANLSFAIESMMRNIRTGRDYSCGAGNGTCSQFSFTDSQDQQITYKVKTDGSLGQCTGTCTTDAQAVALSSPSITIQTLTFIVRGVGTGDNIQPQVMAIVKGTMGTDAGKTTAFVIQTGATQRAIDI
jgi:prepilin-type N-terminal cleavage/methylation domain-containing protein